MCSPAVRLRGTDRWPFWLALAVSQQHPIPLVWMIVLSRAKTNSSSTQGPNKITDLKLQGHAWRFRLHPSAHLISLEKTETDKEEEGGWGCGGRIILEFKWRAFCTITDFSLFSLMCIFLTSLSLSANVSGVSALLAPEITCQSNSVGGTVMSFSLDFPFSLCRWSSFPFLFTAVHGCYCQLHSSSIESKQNAVAAAGNVKSMIPPRFYFSLSWASQGVEMHLQLKTFQAL